MLLDDIETKKNETSYAVPKQSHLSKPIFEWKSQWYAVVGGRDQTCPIANGGSLGVPSDLMPGAMMGQRHRWCLCCLLALLTALPGAFVGGPSHALQRWDLSLDLA
eukprot:s4425_g5.t1